MHEWHTESSTNPFKLINAFTGYEYDTDHSGTLTVEEVKVTNEIFTTPSDARNYVTQLSYYSNYAYMAAYTTKKLSKAYQAAYTNFLTKYNEYMSFKKNLTIAYGRKALRVSCPTCDSSITLKYGGRFNRCPVCGSSKIISDSNWKTLETKRRMSEKAAESLSKEAEKNEVTFVCGIEWHC